MDSNYILQLKGIRKAFGETEVLKGIDLDIARGEFITLLGASGCGKTTTLRIIAGLETPDDGQVFLDGQDITTLEPNKRSVNTVFQSYALFPHMNVADNIGYGLKLKKVPKNQIADKVKEMLKLVQLSGYEKRMPEQLSGGQRQRVAIARAVVNEPKVLLLDEPLGALDLKLRRQMQLELKRLQKQLGITFIYITHDQEEAINMSDRIAVMNRGVLEQVGTPNEIYYRPRTSYVANFVGNANILRCGGKTVGVQAPKESHRGELIAAQVSEKSQHGALTAAQMPEPSDAVAKSGGKANTYAIRTENILMDGEPECTIEAVVREKSFAGGQLRILFELADGQQLTASRYGIDADVQVGSKMLIGWKEENAIAVADEFGGKSENRRRNEGNYEAECFGAR